MKALIVLSITLFAFSSNAARYCGAIEYYKGVITILDGGKYPTIDPDKKLSGLAQNELGYAAEEGDCRCVDGDLNRYEEFVEVRQIRECHSFDLILDN